METNSQPQASRDGDGDVRAHHDDISGWPTEMTKEEIKRDLSARHINMIALAGMIGTGLFLGSGESIARAGPAGALIAYIIMGYAIAINVPAEISAAATLVEYWDDKVNTAAWITIFLVFAVVVNFCNVRLYGETEVVFAMMKIALIIALILSGLIVDLGGGPDHQRIGFRFWKNPGAFSEYLVPGATGRFLALWSTMLMAAFSYGNIQVVAISGVETRNPRVIIPSATRMTALRVLVFYILSILIVGMIVASNDPDLSNGGDSVKDSPFVIAFQRAGISVFPSIINAVVITSAVSAVSACIFISSRTLYGLSRDGHAPRFFQRCNRLGVPYYAVGLSSALGPLVYMTARGGTAKSTTEIMVVFQWFVNITSVAGLICWIVLVSAYLRFFYAMKAQGFSRDDLPYKAPLQPYLSWFTLFMVCVVVFFSGFDVFFPGKWSVSQFLTCYINIFIFLSTSTTPTPLTLHPSHLLTPSSPPHAMPALLSVADAFRSCRDMMRTAPHLTHKLIATRLNPIADATPAAVYVLLKCMYGRRSRIRSLHEIDLQTEFTRMREEIAQGQYVPDKLALPAASSVSDRSQSDSTTWKGRTKDSLRNLKGRSWIRLWVWW
ncbi:hypothetical protein KEM52_002078 [Ascosphaera acerosa]|nr:hypothetical protein KEM52_002078 [Ascosphaera acerosa]